MGKKLIACLFFTLFPVLLHSQAVSPVSEKTAYISAGGFYSIAQTDYGQNHAMGLGAYSDINYRVWRGLGVGAEGEVRFIDFKLIAGTSFQNFLGGPRITYRLRGFEPYAKVLAGGSRFHYPNFISKNAYYYTTFAYGGGLDLKLTNRFYLRAADFEYQHWEFPPTGLTPWAFSTGVSYRIF